MGKLTPKGSCLCSYTHCLSLQSERRRTSSSPRAGPGARTPNEGARRSNARHRARDQTTLLFALVGGRQWEGRNTGSYSLLDPSEKSSRRANVTSRSLVLLSLRFSRTRCTRGFEPKKHPSSLGLAYRVALRRKQKTATTCSANLPVSSSVYALPVVVSR